MIPRWLHPLALAGVLGAASCAPSLSTFQPAHVAPKGHVQAGAGLEIGVPVGAITDAIDQGKLLADRAQSGEPITDDERWQIFDAGVNLILNAPAVGPHLGLAYTLIHRLELSVRYAGTAWRLGGRFQLLDRLTAPFDMVVGLGVSRSSYKFPLADSIPVLKLDDFQRWQFDVPLLIGTSRDWVRVWVGPRFVLTSFDTRLTLVLPSETQVASFEGTAYYAGGQGGVALGYRKVFVGFELTIAQAVGTAHLTSVGLQPPTHDTRVTGLVIYPSFGLMGEF
jgi:hypothetical protein